MPILASLATAMLFAGSGSGLSQADYLNAIAAYRALEQGRITAAHLSPRQRANIREVDRRLREGELPLRTPHERCIDDQVRQNGGDPSRLDWEIIDLACSQH